MTPDPTRDNGALKWVRSELDEALRQARLQLEDRVDGVVENLDDCVRSLHQVNGTLQLVQVYGGAMLAGELEAVAEALNGGKLSAPDAAAEVLMMGIVQLPAYLERVEGGEPDIPLILLPLLNDLRAARGAPLVSEISLFAPQLDSLISAENVVPGSGNPALPDLVKVQRLNFHRGLLNWFRELDPSVGLAAIREVLETIGGEVRTRRLRHLMDASEALVVALQDGMAPGVSTKLLFGNLDRVFKRLIEEGEEAVARDFPLELLKNLLYYVARSDSQDPVVQAIRRSADLANSFPDISYEDVREGNLGGPGKALFDAVGTAIKADLRDIKDQLDLYMRGDRGEYSRLAALVDPVRRVGDTLGMVGRGELRSRLMPHSERLADAVASEQPPSDDQLMGMAGDLLYVESALAVFERPSVGASQGGQPGRVGMSKGEFRAHMHTAIDEGFVELARTKDAILRYLSAPTDLSTLNGASERVHRVAGVLTMMEQPEAAKLLQDLERYLSELGAGTRSHPDDAQKEALADLVSGIEMHMDSILDRRPDNGRALLVAQSASERLGLTGVAAEPADAAPSGDAGSAAAESVADIHLVEDEDVTPGPESVTDAPPAEATGGGATAVQAPAGKESESQQGESEAVVKAAPDATGKAVVTNESVADIDSEILEIFVEEAREEVDAIREAYPVWRQDPRQSDSLTRVRRAFHTLKGSGRLVGALVIGEFAWSVENLLNRVIDGTVSADDRVFGLIDSVIDTLPSLVDEYEAGVGSDAQTMQIVQGLQERAFALAEPASLPQDTNVGVSVDSVDLDTVETDVLIDSELLLASQTGDATLAAETDAPEEPGAGVQASESADAGEVLAVPSADVDDSATEDSATVGELPGQFSEQISVAEGPSEPLNLAPADLLQADAADAQGELEDSGDEETIIEVAIDAPDDLDLISEELLLEDVSVDLDESLQIDSALNESLLDEGGAETDVEASLFVSGLEELSADDEREASSVGTSTEELLPESLLDSHLSFAAGFDHDEVESILLPQEAEPAPIALDSALSDIFGNETRTHLETIGQFIEDCRGRPSGCLYSEQLARALHTLHGAARMAEVKPIAEVAGALEHWINLQLEGGQRTDAASIDLLERAHFVIKSVLDVVNRPGALLPSWRPLLDEIAGGAARLKQDLEVNTPGEEFAEIDPDIDPELLGIFMEEANELSEGMEQQYELWRTGGHPGEAVAQLQRQLHTVKGAARLAGLPQIGDLAHAMESLFESMVEGRVQDSGDRQTLIRQALDALGSQIEALSQNQPIMSAVGICERLEAAAQGDDWVPMETGWSGHSSPPSEQGNTDSPQGAGESSDQDRRQTDEDPDTFLFETTLLSDSQLLTDSELLGDSDLAPETLSTDSSTESSLPLSSRVIQFPTRVRQARDTDPEGERRAPPPAEEPTEQAAASQERVRVRAELLDHMVNNAGEVGIYRARLEQQNKTQGFNLVELSQTIERLRNQLRSLELETEAQILSRHEREYENDSAAADFDPLELDRYSTMQQLSRALSETVNDLSNIGVTLQELNRDSDTLLLQQARITNDLQDGLLRTRMVPVSSRTARLQRVVRQTAQVLGKHAELRVVGGQGEIDRAILERMLAPLEHLLRNAIAHGIESPQERESAGKQVLGSVTLTVGRDGADVVLSVTDDGRGFNREAIRRKAIERGMLDTEAAVEDDDLDQLVLEAGFSTAEGVTQVSGRGVGMDVVLSEIKQLGGSLDISTRPGEGTRFDIRLPFTLAITESLLVNVGEEVYAVPHGSIDGIVRIPRDQLEACLTGKQESFEYGGVDYQVRYLGSLLGSAFPTLPEGVRWFPLLLVRVGEHRVAIQTDGLLGNRQIVIKSVGMQLSTVRWFTGATILADGRIALILDVTSLVRTAHQYQQPQTLEPEEPQNEGVTVMVVDDSITVRKVTSRLLERHNMNVLTAKDGVDAVTVLQEQKPDVMLLDVEMPRMDGFELARHMRSSEDLRDIPIIMITSRTGDKHRNLAFELGVKCYLGKPYQESDLLDNIYTVLAESGDG